MNKRNINTIVMVEDENGDIYTHNIPENAYAVIFDGVQKLVEPKYLQLLPDEITEEAFDHRGIALRVTITKDRMAFCTHQQRGTRMYNCSKNPLCDGVEKAVLYALCLDRNPKVVCLSRPSRKSKEIGHHNSLYRRIKKGDFNYGITYKRIGKEV